jgi:hypothetical protein
MLDDIEIVLQTDLNDALAQVYAGLEARDEARAIRRGVEYVPLTYDQVSPDHYHVGNFPRQVLGDVPNELYPYLVLAVEDMVPDAESANQDHMVVFRQALAVHSLAMATEDEGSEVVYRRALRMGVAVHTVLMSNRATINMFQGIVNPTRGQASIPWTYREGGRNNNRAWYQAVGLSYAIKLYTSRYG